MRTCTVNNLVELQSSELANKIVCMCFSHSLPSLSRSALEVMRLVELLLVLVMEGRKALPKTSIPAMVAKRMDTFPGDRSHRQVIEAIRAGNNEEFFESMETGFDVNFMDDVGQTLLNWAAAFGTYEMVSQSLYVHVELTTITYYRLAFKICV